MRFELDVRDQPDGVTLYAHGELDVSTADRFRMGADNLLGLGRVIRLDLSAVEFIDSTGITALVDVVKRGAGRVTISDDLRPEVRRVLSITGIIRTLPLRPSTDA